MLTKARHHTMRYITRIVFLYLMTLSLSTEAQMLLRSDTLLGNEWIDYDKTYHRFDVAEDGLHKLEGNSLSAQGVNLPPDEKWQLWFMGEEVPLYVSDDDDFGDDDVIVFYGWKNRSGLDSLLFPNKSKQLNPRYSMFTDTSSYYLTSSSDSPLRLEEGAIATGGIGQSLPYYRKTYEIDSNQVAHKAYLRSGTQKLYNSEFNGMAGFGSPSMSRYSYNNILPHHVYDENVPIKFGLRLAAFYSEQQEELILRYQVTTNILAEDSLKSFEVADKTYEFPSRPDGQYIIAISRLNHVNQRQFVVSNLYLEYLSSFHLIDDKINYAIQAANEYVTLQNVEAGSDYFIHDLNNNTFGILSATSDTAKFYHPLSNGRYNIENLANLTSVNQFKRVNVEEHTAGINSFSIVTSKKLYEQSPTPNAIDDYITWRSSEAGGGYDTKLYFIEDIYDRYAYGVRRHPLALNNFSEELSRSDPNGLLLIIGKGRAYTLTRTKEELTHEDNKSFFVPSFGFPASDPLTISPIGQVKPRLASGRLAVSTLEEVEIYLNNIIQFESLAETIPSENPNWKKKMIHLSGGNELANTVRRIFDGMSTAIQQTSFAPDIKTFYKNGTVPVDTIFSDQIYNEINNGVSIVSFFGHSAPNTLGFRIDNESKYANAPLLPLFIALGCSAGNYNIPDQSVAEAYCLMENRGFLNLISSTSISRVFDLEFVGLSLYELIGNHGDSLNLGQLLNQTVSKTLQKSRSQAGQLSLFGDPAVRLHIPQGIDVAVDPTSTSISPDFLGTENDSFEFTFDILSHGKSPQLPVGVKIVRQYPSGNLEVLYDEFVNLDGFRTANKLNIALGDQIAAGQNRLLIQLDERNLIDEQLYAHAESNNSYRFTDGILGFPVFIPSNSLSPLWPRDKSILPSTDITFSTSSGKLLSATDDFYMELDTTTAFSSPAYSQTRVMSEGGVIEFEPEYNIQTNTTYYWRVSPGPDTQTGSFYWNEAQSFVVLPNKEGWNISHYFQFKDTELISLNVDENRVWNFNQQFIPIRFVNGLWESDEQDQLGWFEYNGPSPKSTTLAWDVPNAALAVMAFDHRDNRLINHRGGDYGSIAVNKDKEYFAFENTNAGRDSLIYFIQHVVPEDWNILFYTVRHTEEEVINSDNWVTDSIRNNGVNLFNLLEGYGATSIRTIQESGHVHYLSHFKKTDGHLSEEISFDDTDVLIREFTLPYFENYGAISLDNSIIKPKDRELLEWQYGDDVDTLDSYNIFYQKENNNNREYTNLNTLSGTFDFSTLADSLRAGAQFWSDVSDQHLAAPDPAQAEFFRMYGPVIGDFALAPNIKWDSPNSTNQAGATLRGAIAVRNIHHKIDELPFTVYARNLDDNSETVFLNSTLNISGNNVSNIEFEGLLLVPGNYLLTIEINPGQIISEANYSNNVLQIPLQISFDLSKPLLHVTFDDEQISNGQIVSRSSVISVILQDENPFALLDDTGLLSASIIQPDGSAYSITIGENAEFNLPSDPEFNALELVINGSFQQEGLYSLVAFGRDQSGNSQDVAYHIDFQILNKIGFGMTTYPNPVINSLFIDYLLFGMPKDGLADLYISNALGKIVMHGEIGLVEGRHRIAIDILDSWPTGTYQYEVIVRGENGGEYSEYVDEALGFFADGRRGQFVLLR